MTDIRPEVVSLLVDIDPTGWTPGKRPNHDNGEPFTEAEAEMFGSATRAEVEAARDYATRAANYATEQFADMTRISEITEPYFQKLGAGATFRDVYPLMGETERTELDAIVDRIAPDGTVPVRRPPAAS